MSRVIRVRGRGGPEVLRVEERATPDPGRGEVQVRVEAAGVAYGDVMRRRGVLAPPWTFTPGYDIAGVVEAVGRGVDSSLEGTRVAAMMPRTGFGGYADHVIVPRKRLARVPDSVSSTQAGALILNYITARQLLERYSGLGSEAGTLLVHGGAGGVGTAVLQLAALKGVTTFATASAKKHDLIRELGATPIDYRAERFEDAIERLCPGGVDAALDGIGGEYLRRTWRSLRRGGRLVSFGLTGEIEKGWRSIWGAFGSMLRLYLDRSRSLKVYLVGTRYGVQDDLQAVLDLAGEGAIAPIIGAELPLTEVAEAHRLLEEAAVVGKIVLVP